MTALGRKLPIRSGHPDGLDIGVGKMVSFEEDKLDPNSFLGSKCLWGVLPPLKSKFHKHPRAPTKALLGGGC